MLNVVKLLNASNALQILHFVQHDEQNNRQL